MWLTSTLARVRSKYGLPCTSQQLLYNAQASTPGIPHLGNTGLTKSQHQEREGFQREGSRKVLACNQLF